MTDLQSSIQIGIVNDGTTFDDRKRERFVSVVANATVSPSKVQDLVSFIQDIDRLNESDIAALKILNSVMNKQGDWDLIHRASSGTASEHVLATSARTWGPDGVCARKNQQEDRWRQIQS